MPSRTENPKPNGDAVTCATCRHWEAKEYVTPERGVCWMHYGLAKAQSETCDRWNSYARHAESVERPNDEIRRVVENPTPPKL